MVFELTYNNPTLLQKRKKLNGTLLMKLRALMRKTSIVFGIFIKDFDDSTSMDIVANIDMIRKPWNRYFTPTGDFDEEVERQAFNDEAIKLNKIRVAHYDHPSIKFHEQLIMAALTTLKSGLTQKLSPDDIIHNLRVDEEWICEIMKSYFDDGVDLDEEINTTFSDNSEHSWHPNVNERQVSARHRTYSQAMKEIIDLCKHRALNEKVVRYLLNPHISTASHFDHGQQRIRFYINIFPETLGQSYVSQIFGERGASFTSEEETKAMDRLFETDADKFQSWADSIGRDEKKIPSRQRKGPERKEGVQPSDREDPPEVDIPEEEDLDFTVPEGAGSIKDDDDPEAEQGDDEDENSKPTGSSDQPPPPPHSHTGGNVIPDDSGYVPDAKLAFKASGYIKKFQNETKQDEIDRHDHMTRFNTTSEGPMAIHKSILRPWDYRIRTGNTSLSPMMMITFTRMSKKPIFNPVQ